MVSGLLGFHFRKSLVYELLQGTLVYIYIYTHTHTHTYNYLVTSWSRVFFEKLTVSQLVTKVFGTRRFFTHSHVPVTCPYPEPDRSSPCPHIPLPEDPS